ncbi:MAG TPA: hypothetical protein VHV55_14275 [Pirellulales bacterium]|nr:hypothetical protein [Pirellulales bacterium]
MLSRFRFRVKPSERDEVFVQKLANGVRIAAASRANHPQANLAQLRQHLAAAGERDDQFLAKARHPIQQRPELAVGDSQNARCTAGDGTDQHRPTGQQIDIAGKLPRFMGDNHTVVSRWIANFDLPGFNDVQIDFGLTGRKNGFAIRKVARRCQGFDEREFCAG